MGSLALEASDLLDRRKDYASDDDKVKSDLMEGPVIDDGIFSSDGIGSQPQGMSS
jgi:hypothetical protein